MKTRQELYSEGWTEDYVEGYFAGANLSIEDSVNRIRRAYVHTANDHCPTRTRNKLDCNCSDKSLGCDRAVRAITKQSE